MQYATQVLDRQWMRYAKSISDHFPLGSGKKESECLGQNSQATRTVHKVYLSVVVDHVLFSEDLSLSRHVRRAWIFSELRLSREVRRASVQRRCQF